MLKIRVSELIKDLLVIVTIVCLTLICIELGAYVYVNINRQPQLSSQVIEPAIEDGLYHVKYFQRASVADRWEEVANIKYHNDSINERIVNPLGTVLGTNSEQPKLEFFGCSFTYGEGLNDEDTFPYMVQQRLPGFTVHNRSHTGYSTSNMLQLLRKQATTEEVSFLNDIGIYVYIDDHIRRNIGSVEIMENYTWGRSLPYFAREEGTLVEKGNLYDNSPNRVLYKSLSNLNLLKVFNIELPVITKSDLDFTIDLIKESQITYQNLHPNGTFYVLLHPLWNFKQSDSMIALFEQNGIRYIDGRQFAGIGPSQDEYYLPYENHPNREINEIITQGLLDNLQLQQ